VGAGTVEFLLTREREFFFLEMNTRLQVEHPVTECLTGLDLVRLQIHVAEGDALPYEVVAATRRGHAIEVRLCAEDPDRGLLPATGRLERFHIPAGPGIRIDAGVADGSPVSPHYDSLLAKVVAHAPTRAQAISRLVGALSGARLHGVPTNRDLLLGLLRHPDFVEGRTDIHFLDRVPPLELASPLSAETRRLHAAAAALAESAERRRTAPILGSLPSGWRNNPSQLQEIAFEGEGGRVEIAYAWRGDGLVLRAGPHEFLHPRVSVLGPDLVDLEADGVRRRYEVHRVGDVHYVDSVLGHSALRAVARFPKSEPAAAEGAIRSPLPGRVARVLATVGLEVTAGGLLVVIEAMKMEHQVRAPRSARVAAVHVKQGQQVDAGAVLVALAD
jgi:acetyl/propionyl-CoA carboxylase alpha subunit